MPDTFLCSIQTDYIDYLRSFTRLKHVYDNKDGFSVHSRKYLGIVLTIGPFQYYVPLSSPKDSDYQQTPNGIVIRKSVIPIIRILADDATGQLELKGTLRISNMIPVPNCAIIPYIIADEQDLNYRILVEKEYAFIKANKNLILNNCRVLYNQKSNEEHYFLDPAKKPVYLNSTVDFKYAEEQCLLYASRHTKL